MPTQTYVFTGNAQEAGFFENSALYTGSTSSPFVYYEGSSNTINFGYGLNLTSLARTFPNLPAATGTLAALAISALSNLGLTLTQDQWTNIANNPSADLGVQLDNVISGTSTIEDVQAAASDLTQAYINNSISSIQNALGSGVWSGLSASAQMGLLDAYYNTGGSAMGPNLLADLQAGDMTAAAIELATNTNTFAQARLSYDSLLLLGLSPSIDANHLIQSITFPSGQTVSGQLADGSALTSATTGCAVSGSTTSGEVFISYSTQTDSTGQRNVGISYNPTTRTTTVSNSGNAFGLSSTNWQDIAFNNNSFSISVPMSDQTISTVNVGADGTILTSSNGTNIQFSPGTLTGLSAGTSGTTFSLSDGLFVFQDGSGNFNVELPSAKIVPLSSGAYLQSNSEGIGIWNGVQQYEQITPSGVVSVTLSGQGNTIDVSNANISIADNAQADVTGSGDICTLGNDATLTCTASSDSTTSGVSLNQFNLGTGSTLIDNAGTASVADIISEVTSAAAGSQAIVQSYGSGDPTTYDTTFDGYGGYQQNWTATSGSYGENNLADNGTRYSSTDNADGQLLSDSWTYYWDTLVTVNDAYAYGQNGNMSSWIETSSDGGSSVNLYNDAGNVVSETRTDSTGETSSDTFAYNASGNLTSHVWTGPNESGQETLTYDPTAGYLTSDGEAWTKSNGTSGSDTYTFNAAGNVTGYSWTSNGPGGYSSGYYGYYGGGYGFSKSQAAGSNIGAIAQYDLDHGNLAAAAAADAAQQQTDAVAAMAPQAPGAGSAVLEGAKWDSQVITWSLANSAGTSTAPFSSYMDESEEAAVQQAFATWAAASGLQFQEVSDSAQSDIRIGWGSFDTANTSVLGYTSFQVQAGQIEPDAIVRIEDPTQDALATSSTGQQDYSGTDANLSQILLHEIGHALGLASNADPTSVMYYELTSNNQTLDATDIAGIQALYSSDQTAGSVLSGSTSANQLIQAMAGLAVTRPGQTTPLAANQLLLQAPLLAASH